MISVVIPNYNKAGFISEALQSLLDQSFDFWEAIIVDDGSTDDSLKIIDSFIENDTRFKLLTRKRKPKGAPTCRNIGLENCKYDFVVFLDSDDLFASYAFQQRLDLIKDFSPQDFYVFQSLIFENEPSDKRKYVSVETKTNLKRRIFSLEVPWTISSVLWRKKALLKLNGFNESLQAKQDPDLVIRALFNEYSYKVYWSSVPDFFYRISSSSIGLNLSRAAVTKRLISSEIIANDILQYFNSFELIYAKYGVGKIALDLIESYGNLKEYGKAFDILSNFEGCFSWYQKKMILLYLRLSKKINYPMRGFQYFRRIMMKAYWLPNNYAIHDFRGELDYKSDSNFK